MSPNDPFRKSAARRSAGSVAIEQLQTRQLAMENATILKRAIDAETMLDQSRGRDGTLRQAFA
jgi:hypothetical protein